MLALEPAAFASLCPDTVTFNTMLQRAVRRHDKSEARRIFALMRSRGVAADSYTLGAIGTLKTPPSPTTSFSADDSGASSAEGEVDAWLAQLQEGLEATGGGRSAGPLNQASDRASVYDLRRGACC